MEACLQLKRLVESDKLKLSLKERTVYTGNRKIKYNVGEH